MESESLEHKIAKEIENELLYSILDEKYDLSNKSNDSSNSNSDNDNSNSKDNDQEEIITNKKHKRRKIESKKRKNRLSQINIRTVILLLVTLIANTYAWFIYNSMVSTKIDVHIKSWQFELEAGENSEDFVLQVEEIYPGMNEAGTTIEANNKGEMDAKLSCRITHIRILDEDFYVEPENDADRVPGMTYYTSDELLDKLLNDYPFKIQIYVDGILYDGENDIIISASSPRTSISYRVNWPYETGTGASEISANDAIDTEWGERAYEYYHDETNPGNHYCIEVNLTIIAVQHTSP